MKKKNIDMINPTGNKLEKILFEIFDKSIENADRYDHNKSLWLIFTNDMKWVVEYTDSQTLWYNYQFFKNEMELVGLDCVENKDLIQKWFETRFLNTYVVKSAEHLRFDTFWEVEDTVKNGVKHTIDFDIQMKGLVEDTIQNGVKDTLPFENRHSLLVEDTIKNGVKDTQRAFGENKLQVEDTIQNGVKHTIQHDQDVLLLVEDTIQNGVKHTALKRLDPSYRVEDAIKNGVKEVKEVSEFSLVSEIFKVNSKRVIQKGVKYTSSGSGKPYWVVEDTVQNEVKKTSDRPLGIELECINDIIQNGVKSVDFAYNCVDNSVEDIIKNGVKYVDFAFDLGYYGDTTVEDIIENGEKI